MLIRQSKCLFWDLDEYWNQDYSFARYPLIVRIEAMETDLKLVTYREYAE